MLLHSIELLRRMSSYPATDPRYTMTFDEEAEAIINLTLEDVKSFFTEFYSASDATIAVVGDFDPAATEAALDRNFSDWTSDSGYSRLVDKYEAAEPENLELETPDKANAIFLASQNLPMSRDHEDYPAMVLGNYMLGGWFLEFSFGNSYPSGRRPKLWCWIMDGCRLPG